MSGRHRAAASVLLVLALALAFLAQFYFLRRPEYRWDGLLFVFLSALCFVLSWRLSRPAAAHPTTSRPAPLPAWIREHWSVVALVGLGCLLSLVAAWQARSRAWNQDTAGVVILWFAGLGTILAATFWPTTLPALFLRFSRGRHSEGAQRLPSSGAKGPKYRWSVVRASARSGLSKHRFVTRSGAKHLREVVFVALLTALALALRVIALDRMPYTLAGDEAWFGTSARQVVEGVIRNPFVTGHLSMPTLFFWTMAWAMRLFGDGMAAIRLPAALVGTATIPLFYLFVRDLWGRRTACLTASFLAAYELHIHYSRLALNNAWDPFFAVLTFWLLERGLAQAEERLRLRDFLLTGLVLGLGLYFYTGARLLPLLVAACILFFSRQRRLEGQAASLAGPLALMGLACLAAAAPILGFALAHPDDWNARMNQVGILQSGWLDVTRQLTGKGTAHLLADQFLRAAGAFHVFPDRSDFFGIQRPLLAFFPAVLAILGMVWASAHVRERRYFLVLIWFWAVIVTGGMLTESPPSSQRLLLAVPAMAIFVSTGLEQSVHLGHRLLGASRRWADLLLGLALFAIALGSIRFYFAEYLPSGRYGSENGETATMIGHYVAELDAGYRIYLFGWPRLGWGFGSMGFLAPQIEAQDVADPLVAPPDFVDTGRGAALIFLPERLGELDWVQAAFPAGTLREFHDSRGRLRFAAYEVQAEAVVPGSSP